MSKNFPLWKDEKETLTHAHNRVGCILSIGPWNLYMYIEENKINQYSSQQIEFIK